MARFRVLLLALGAGASVLLSGCHGGSGISISLSPSTTPTINQGATQSITATVSNDSTNAGVTWTLSGPGVLSDSSITSVTYVAPSVLSANTSATVTATSITNTSVTTSLSITIDAVFAFTSSLSAASYSRWSFEISEFISFVVRLFSSITFFNSELGVLFALVAMFIVLPL